MTADLADLDAAAYADPMLDPYFRATGPCGLCGTALPQRHRVIDAAVDHLAAG